MPNHFWVIFASGFLARCSMYSYQAGEVVCLKSGGPDMTIESVQSGSALDTGIVTCVWFVDKTLYRTSLPVSALTSAMWPVAA